MIGADAIESALVDRPSAVCVPLWQDCYVTDHWEQGQLIVRREVLGLGPGFHPASKPSWYSRVWAALPVYVIEDTADQLVTYLPEGAEIGCVDGDWPTSDRKHPWHHKANWEGHGSLMVQRPGDPHAVWHFWSGPDREFACWYINLQAAFVRSPIGYDTQDFELDIIVYPDGSHVLKDLEVLDDRVDEGRFTADLVTWIRKVGAELSDELSAGRRWWDPKWARWTPPETWRDARLPADWASTA